MGYDLHITRSENWIDPDGPRISIDEWLALIDADPELDPRSEVTARLPDGEVLTLPMENLAVWTGHPQAVEVPFHFTGGRISVPMGDTTALAKAHQIAAALDARIQGDEGEFYEPEPVAPSNRS